MSTTLAVDGVTVLARRKTAVDLDYFSNRDVKVIGTMSGIDLKFTEFVGNKPNACQFSGTITACTGATSISAGFGGYSLYFKSEDLKEATQRTEVKKTILDELKKLFPGYTFVESEASKRRGRARPKKSVTA